MLHTLAAGSFKDNVNSAKNVICAKTKQSKESRPRKRLDIWRGFFNAKLSAADRAGGAIFRRAATDVVRSTERGLALT